MNIANLMYKAFQVQWPTAIVVESHELLFFPVPKVASSSMKRYLITLEVGASQLVEMSHNSIHAYPFTLVKCSSWNYRFGGFKSFAIIRDPYERIYSCYRDKILKSVEATGNVFNGFERYNKLLRRRLFYPDMTFEKFCRVVSSIPDFLSDGHFRSQTSFLPKDLDYLIDVSRLDESMHAITRLLNLPEWEEQGARLNRTRAADSKSESWSKQLKGLIEKRYGEDLHLYKKLNGIPYAENLII